jgi:outer membrane lipase/esterase
MMNSKGNWARRALAGLGAALALMVLAGCGGGTEQITPFAPTRLLVLGDEMSVLTNATDVPIGPIGRKYSVNAVNTADPTQIDCVAFPIWHQVVAYTYAFAYEECNPDNQPETNAKIYAAKGAKVSDLVGQLARAAIVANGSFSNTDLFTVLVGANDVLDVYQNIYLLNPGTDAYNAGLAELRLRGVRLAAFVNQLTRADVGDITGPKVIVSTIPLMSQTPFARQEALARPGVPVLDVLYQFSVAFNTALRAGDQANGFRGIVNDGRFIGLVELDALLNAGFNDPPRYGLVNSLQPVCAMPLPDCNNPADLVSGGNAITWLWASELWMGPTAHLNLGNFARGRALDNPF